MNNLWGSNGTLIKGLGTIVAVRMKYGKEIQATIRCGSGEDDFILVDGSDLYKEYPNIFS